MGEIADYYSWGGGAPEPDDLEVETDGRIYEGVELDELNAAIAHLSTNKEGEER